LSAGGGIFVGVDLIVESLDDESGLVVVELAFEFGL